MAVYQAENPRPDCAGAGARHGRARTAPSLAGTSRAVGTVCARAVRRRTAIAVRCGGPRRAAPAVPLLSGLAVADRLIGLLQAALAQAQRVVARRAAGLGLHGPAVEL